MLINKLKIKVVLPNGTGKNLKVLVFAKGPKAEEAEKAGADFVGAEELIPKSKMMDGLIMMLLLQHLIWWVLLVD